MSRPLRFDLLRRLLRQRPASRREYVAVAETTAESLAIAFADRVSARLAAAGAAFGGLTAIECVT